MGYRFLRKLTPPSKAMDAVIKHCKVQLGQQVVDFNESLGMIVADDLVALSDISPVDKSAVDGYAVVGIRVLSASQQSPVRLKVVGSVRIGERPVVKASPNSVIKVATGAAIPQGFDTVIPAEYVTPLGERVIEVSRSFPLGDNVIRKGEDVKKGQVVLKRGKVVNAFDVAMLAQLRMTEVRVLEKLRVGIIPTGSEVVEPFAEGGAYETVNTNTYMLLALCSEPWIDAHRMRVVPDDIDRLAEAVKAALTNHHVLLIIGGTSVGEMDLVPEAVQRAGETGVMVRGVAIQPGRATGLAVVNGKPIFMLSGFPVACAVGFHGLAKPLLYRLVGSAEPPRPTVKAVLASRVTSSLGVANYVRVKVKEVRGKLVTSPVRASGSSIISSLTDANGFLIVPPDSEGFEKGSQVEVLLYNHVYKKG